MVTQLIKVSKLKNNTGQVEGLPKNPRILKDDKFEKLKKSIQDDPEMLLLREVIAYDNNGELVVICGNMRLKALIELGIKEVPTKILPIETSIEKLKAYTIKDNVGFGEHNWELLANEWDSEELEEWGLDIPNFDNEESLEAKDDNFDSEVKETSIVAGDLIEIGNHRLICGDSFDSDVITKLMNGQKADMIFTDPPYEIDFDYANILISSENSNVFIFNNDRAIIRQLQISPLKFKKFFIFAHDGCAIPQEGGNEAFLTHILMSHEILGEPLKYQKGDGLRTIIKGEYRRSEHHKHEKPQSLISDILKAYSIPNNIILDFFAGGGSLLIGCMQMDRICYMCELDPLNCQTIIDRAKNLEPNTLIKINGVTY